jgi:Tetratricopeptide repeat
VLRGGGNSASVHTAHATAPGALQGRFAEAEAWWLKARAEAIEGFGASTAHLAVVANGLAEVYRCAGGERFAEAEALYRESVAIVEREYGTADARCAFPRASPAWEEPKA